MMNIKVASNWQVLDKELIDTVEIKKNDNNSFNEYSVQNTVDIEKCVCLIAPEVENGHKIHPEITFSLSSDHRIVNLKIVSEARVVELYGTESEYLNTHHSSFIDDWEGMAVYKTDITAPHLNHFSIKFLKTKEENRLWIYGILVLIEEDEQNRNHINFTKVPFQQMSEQDQQSIPERLEKFKTLLNMCSSMKLRNNDRPLNNHPFLEICKTPNYNFYRKMQNVCNDKNENITFQELKEPNPQHDSTVQGKDVLSVELNYMQQYMDMKFDLLKKQILSEVDERFQHIEMMQIEYFKKIIALLEKKEINS